MEREITFEFGNKEYKLVFTSGIELDILEKYELQSIFDIFQMPGSARISAIMDFVSRMNVLAGGEKFIAPENFFPNDLLRVQTAALKAIAEGYRREIPPGEIDEGLAELEKKKDEQPARTSWFSRVFGSIFRKKTHTTRRRGSSMTCLK